MTKYRIKKVNSRKECVYYVQRLCRLLGWSWWSTLTEYSLECDMSFQIAFRTEEEAREKIADLQPINNTIEYINV